MSIFAQEESNIWYFGINAGLNFNSNPPTPLLDLPIGTFSSEGCSTISDSNGNVLFYTNGEKVWNKNFHVMFNGDNLAGHNSSTQSSAIIPYPGTYNFTENRFDKYFLVTLDDYTEQAPNSEDEGVRYSEIDMSLDNGLGVVTQNKNIHLFGTTTTEKVCVVPHSNGCDFWVICKVVDSNNFYSYHISSNGFNVNPVISTTSFFVDARPGQMKVSPDNKLLSYVVPSSSNYEGLYVFNFNNSTGLITEKFADTTANENQYGTAFSPNSKVLYKCAGSRIYQYDVSTTTNNDFITSKTIFISSTSGLQSMQLAPDGKIYIARPILISLSGRLGVINNPNVLGENCNYVSEQQDLGGRFCLAGLPNQLNNLKPYNEIIIENELCNSLQLALENNNNILNYNWGLAYVTNPQTYISTSLEATPTLNIPNQNEHYIITCTIVSECYSNTYQLLFSPRNSNSVIPSFNLLTNTYCQNQTPNSLPLTSVEGIAGTWTPNIINTTIVGTSSYTFTPNQDQCAYQATIEITIKPNIKIDFQDTIICEGTTISFPSTNGVDGTWYPTNINTTQNTTYTFTPIDNCGQSSTWQVIFLESLSDLSISTFNNTVIVNVVSSNNMLLYQLDNGNFQYSNIFENVSFGCHTIKVTDLYGCTELSSSVFIFDYPKFFTPNNDGYNDYWNIVIENTDANLYIFDRYGKLLKEINQNEIGWDGTCNGNKLPSTDYWFVLEYDECGVRKTFKSHFGLMR
ncbi:T9SS type B sorting domain-containing protein [Flavobacterium sp. UBA7663]|uniref:T9SS type B sorting domain-containing protein n=1 Tax=Flavobacterium sp. UBA7663 TaxID=1946557 RepID=UPI0025B82124|nr:T9SS type B sorting domain-containing protein [Flavobacterium sp. UBA7663]